jgi:hypothetical protein
MAEPGVGEGQQRQPNLLNDVLGVGPQKSLGFLSRRTIEECGSNLEDIRAQLSKKGVQTKLYTSKEDMQSPSDVLYAFDTKTLEELLEKNRAILNDNRWPTEVNTFIDWCANRERDPAKIVPPKTPLYTLIADAFADYKNPDRLK